MINALVITKLFKTYNNGISALKGIDLTVKAGDFFALLGTNGAGKSTTIGIITTLLTKTSGLITICGYDLDTQPANAKSCLGLVPQEFNLNIFETCEQILLNQAGFYGITRQVAQIRTNDLLVQLGLWDKRHAIIRHLSGGMKRRLMIARALIHQPDILILDEPTAGVDIEIRCDMWNFLKQINASGTTIILTTHYLEEAEQLCKNIAIIDHGKIVKNTSMKTLLNTACQQTFVFSSEKNITQLPKTALFTTTLLDDNTFEVGIDSHVSLNDVFSVLSDHKIFIHSLRNKTNRLEAIFLDLINHDR
jgi:ABC-2 type transport system ATP-binding protein